MKSGFKIGSALALSAALLHGVQAEAQKKETFVESKSVASVDPYIGSGEHGHVFVGASVPYGAISVGPTNIVKGWDWCSGYHYSDSVLIGFSQQHLSGTGIGDLGDVLVMPYTGKVRTNRGTQEDPTSGYGSHYSHSREKARPGYYSVQLDDYNILAELTASEEFRLIASLSPKINPLISSST